MQCRPPCGEQLVAVAKTVKLKKYLQNCSSVFVLLQYLQCIATQQPRGSAWNPEQTPLTQQVGQLVTIQSEKETQDLCAQTLLLTGARAVQQRCHWIAVTPLHATMCVARYNQIPGGRDQQKTNLTRKPQGTTQDEGGTLPEGNEPKQQTTQKKTHRTTQTTPSKAKTHTQHHRTNGKRPKPNHNRRTRHWQSKPINRAGRLTKGGVK